MPINVAKKSFIRWIIRFLFRPCYLERERKRIRRWKGKKGREREREEEKQRRGGKKNRRVNCFPAANGRQLKLKILDYLHRAFTHVPTHVERETNVTRRSTWSRDNGFESKIPKSVYIYISGRGRWASKIAGFEWRQGVRAREVGGGRVGYGTSGRLSQFPDFNIDGCRERARALSNV